MPRTLYTPTGRTALAITDVFPDAVVVSRGDEEDVFQVGKCRVTCRYWTSAGDFVSKQILGCCAAIRSGRLRSANPKAIELQVHETRSVIGMIGPDGAVCTVASALASRFRGVLIDGEQADLAEQE